jgi:hypothetical protein
VELLTSALIEMLKSPVASGGTGKTVFDQRWKGDTPNLPYLVVKRVGGQMDLGPFLTAPNADLHVHYQVDVVGSRRDQVERVEGQVRESILGRTATGAFKTTLTVAGWVVADRDALNVLPPIEIEGTPPQERFAARPQFALYITPA